MQQHMVVAIVRGERSGLVISIACTDSYDIITFAFDYRPTSLVERSLHPMSSLTPLQASGVHPEVQQFFQSAVMVPARPADPAEARVIAVIVTRDRPALLRRCLDAVLDQARPPEAVIVIDNASQDETREVLGHYPAVNCLRLARNVGGAGGFCAGIQHALDDGAEWLWLMDDDGRPAGPSCLGGLLATAAAHRAELVGPLVVDVDARRRLSFPVRIAGRTLFDVEAVVQHGPVPGFAHLFNGALIHADLFRRIGLPDARFFIRGDEVEFLFRVRRAGARIVLDTAAHFLHPGSQRDIHPILWGRFYAVVPQEATKQFYQFRNRAYIFRRYGMWGWLAADLVRYGCYFLISQRADVAGLARWIAATGCGIRGRFMRD